MKPSQLRATANTVKLSHVKDVHRHILRQCPLRVLRVIEVFRTLVKQHAIFQEIAEDVYA